MKITAIRAALIATILGAAALSGCANVNVDVQAVNAGGDWQGARIYTLARPPFQDASDDHTQYDTSVRAELNRYGFTDAPGQDARYLVTIAYETRPATVGVSAGMCTDDGTGACPAKSAGNSGWIPSSLAWLGRRSYQHTLTLRFFDKTNGREVYKVSATIEDYETEPLHAIPYLVRSALAQFPFDGHPDWRVKLHIDEARGAPQVISVKPVQR